MEYENQLELAQQANWFIAALVNKCDICQSMNNERWIYFMQQIDRLKFLGNKAEVWARLFIFSASFILLITGMAKIFSTFGGQEVLDLIDPIFKISFRHLMFLVGALEIAVSIVCFFIPRTNLCLGLIGWMSTNFLMYRLGIWYVGWRRPCPCVGNFADMLHLSANSVDLLIKTLFLYLLINSYCLVFLNIIKPSFTKIQT